MQSHRFRLTTAFSTDARLAGGDLESVLRAVWPAILRNEPVTLFDDATGRMVEVDLRGGLEAAIARLPDEPEAEPEAEEPSAPRGPGRPKLGVVAREITLLPRHWDWLATQPGGASVTLRKLVEAARRDGFDKERRRRALDTAYRFMSIVAGDRPGFEEASRALFANDLSGFALQTMAWPKDIADHIRKLAADAFNPDV
jgi:uncharacterized protein